ncbi:MAG: MarC family protein [Candidatus Baltobacteraceae bacterium]
MEIHTGRADLPPIALSEVFIVLFVTLGPINFVKLFGQLTHDATEAFSRKLALRAIVIATISLLASAVVGSVFLTKWRISVGAIAITAAILLFVVAMKSILALYAEPSSHAHAAPAPSLESAVTPLAFPGIVTPYGIAVMIVLLTLGPTYLWQILGLVAVVLLLDLTIMFFFKPIMRAIGVPLSMLGVVLSVLQIALSIQFALLGIRAILAHGV